MTALAFPADSLRGGMPCLGASNSRQRDMSDTFGALTP